MATLIDDDPLITPHTGDVRSLQVWHADDGSVVAIVTDSPGRPSLMNASPTVWKAVQERHPGARVLEHYPEDSPPVGPLRESDGTGGSGHVPLSALDALGIPRPV